MDFFEKLGAARLGSISLGALFDAIIVFLICVIASRLLLRLLGRIFERSRLDGVIRGFIRTGARAGLWILTAIITAETLGINTTSLVAVLSVAGLALSLAMQNILSNVFSGVTLLINRPFKAGDYVDIGASSGTVKTVNLFYTVLDTADNKSVSIPNSTVTGATVVNYSAEPLRRVDLSYSVSYGAATEDVRAAILEAAGMDERVLSSPAPFAAISSYGDSSISFTARLWCKNADYWGVVFTMNENLRESFARHGVEMSYPHMNVHLGEE